MECNNIPSLTYNFSLDLHSSHRKIIELVGSNKRVLDVGCSKGYLSKALKDKGCYVIGIERDKISAELARSNCDKIIIEDLDYLSILPFENEFFDVIVCADVLEHLKDPAGLISKLKDCLKPGGLFIGSIPNVARLDVRIKLFFGRFNYAESGIMDKTHLKFYTLATAKKLFSDCGLKLINIDYTGLASKIKIFPTLFAFQFIIQARRKNR